MNDTHDLFGSCIRQALSEGIQSYSAPVSSTESAIVQSGQSIVPRARRNNPHTSVQAALSAIGLSNAHRIAILACLKLYGEQTFHEIAARTGLEPQQVNKRTSELLEQGLIQRVATGHTDDGKPIYWTRPSPTGRQCCVWQVQQNASS